MQAKPPRGFYKLTISVNPKKADKRLIGTAGAEVNISVVKMVLVLASSKSVKGSLWLSVLMLTFC